MQPLNFHIKQICKRNADGSFTTRAQRESQLHKFANQLHQLGYRGIKHPGNLQPKHVFALIDHWRGSGLSNGTQKNHLAAIRWLAEKSANTKLLQKTNAQWGVERRRLSTLNKALVFEPEQIRSIADPHVQMSARLQAAFGLRREEAMKFVPLVADKGDKIWIRPSWAKGGRAREIPIRTAEQRQVVEEARVFAGGGSLIPPDKTYREHMRVFETQMRRAGLGHSHGARHCYAQTRYAEITGFSPPNNDSSQEKLSDEKRSLDHAARQIISRELGHERIAITRVYLG